MKSKDLERLKLDYWLSKTGDVYKIENMDLNYLSNVKKLIERNYKPREYKNTKIYKLVTAEINSRKLEKLKDRLNEDEQLKKVFVYLTNKMSTEDLETLIDILKDYVN